MEKVALSSGLQNLMFGVCFNKPMEKVALTSSLQNLTFGTFFKHHGENGFSQQPSESDIGIVWTRLLSELADMTGPIPTLQSGVQVISVRKLRLKLFILGQKA